MDVGALAAIFATSFVVSLTGALTPGPLTTLAVREGASRGFWAGPALAAGHGAIELALVVAVTLGLDRVLDDDRLSGAIALAGGTFLVWMGGRTVLSAGEQTLEIGEGQSLVSGVRTLPAAEAAGLAATGIAVSVSNPFWVLWWATVGTAYIAESLDEGAAGVGVFYGAHILTDLGWLSLIALAMATGRRIMSGTIYRGIFAVCGVFLLALGGWFLASGVGYLV